MISGILRERSLVQPWLPPGERTSLAFHPGGGRLLRAIAIRPDRVNLQAALISSRSREGARWGEEGVSLAARERLCIVLLRGSFERYTMRSAGRALQRRSSDWSRCS